MSSHPADFLYNKSSYNLTDSDIDLALIFVIVAMELYRSNFSEFVKSDNTLKLQKVKLSCLNGRLFYEKLY